MFSTCPKMHEAVFFHKKWPKNDSEKSKKQITAPELCPLLGGGGAVSIITQRFLNNSKITLKKSRKPLFRPPKWSKMTPQNCQNEPIFHRKSHFFGSFIDLWSWRYPQKYQKLPLPIKTAKMSYILTEYFNFRGHLSTFRAVNTHRSRPWRP